MEINEVEGERHSRRRGGRESARAKIMSRSIIRARALSSSGRDVRLKISPHHTYIYTNPFTGNVNIFTRAILFDDDVRGTSLKNTNAQRYDHLTE